jgi:hypothetical protein
MIKVVGLLFILFFSTILGALAQVNEQFILLHEKGFGNHYFLNGTRLSQSQLAQRLSGSSASAQSFKSYKSHKFWGNFLSISGTAIVAFSIGSSIVQEKDLAWGQIGLGAGCIIASIPFKLKQKKWLLKSILLYNQSMDEKFGFSYLNWGVAPGFLITIQL